MTTNSFSPLKSLPTDLLLVVLIALGLIGGLVSAAHRWSAEARNRRVELVVDYGDAQALANTTRRQIDDVLAQLKAAGITTVAVTEDSLATLNGNGILSYARDGDTTLLTFAPGFPGQRARVIQMLAHKAPGLIVTPEGENGLLVGGQRHGQHRQAQQPACCAPFGELHGGHGAEYPVGAGADQAAVR